MTDHRSAPDLGRSFERWSNNAVRVRRTPGLRGSGVGKEMAARSEGQQGPDDAVRRMLRWVSLLDLIAFLLVLGSVFLSWQTSAGRYAAGTFSFHYYVYGTQCAQFGGASTCTPATDLPTTLRAIEYLVVAVAPIALVGGILSRIAGHAPTHSRQIAALSAGFSGAGFVGALSAALLYARYTYAHGTGLWDSPSTAGLGWDSAIVASIVLVAALVLSLWARRKGARSAPP